MLKEKRKLRDKMDLKMVIPGDEPLQTDEPDLFNLKNIKKKFVSLTFSVWNNEYIIDRLLHVEFLVQ